jgi:hypothetical protein
MPAIFAEPDQAGQKIRLEPFVETMPTSPSWPQQMGPFPLGFRPTLRERLHGNVSPFVLMSQPQRLPWLLHQEIARRGAPLDEPRAVISV